MADRGFDIKDDLVLLGVHRNIPPFLRGSNSCPRKSSFQQDVFPLSEFMWNVQMERINNFHIFDRSIPASLTDITDRIFFVCCVLSNFQPPLCT